jgi:hypothetical protein
LQGELAEFVCVLLRGSARIVHEVRLQRRIKKQVAI